MNTKTLLGAALLCCSLTAGAGNKYNVLINGGIVHIRGAITAQACGVSAQSVAQIVDMGQFRSNQFSDLGAYAPPVPFSIELSGCSTAVSDTVAVTFLGVSDDRDPHVFSIEGGENSATGVGLAIFDNAGTGVVPNAAPQPLVLLSEGVMLLRFTARYRATAREVNGGHANAWTWFAVSYQ